MLITGHKALDKTKLIVCHKALDKTKLIVCHKALDTTHCAVIIVTIFFFKWANLGLFLFIFVILKNNFSEKL